MSFLKLRLMYMLVSCIVCSQPATYAEQTNTVTEVESTCVSIKEQKLLSEITSPVSLELTKRYSEYRKRIVRVIFLEDELKKEKGDSFELEVPKNLLWQKRIPGHLSHEQELKRLVFPGPAYHAREQLKQLIGIQNVAKIDEFLNVSKRTLHLIESGTRTFDIGTQASPAPLPAFLRRKNE